MTDKKPKKSLSELLEGIKPYREFVNKNFVHKEDGTSYQLLMVTHDVASQEVHAVFCLNAMSAIKFSRPISEFMEKFEEGHSNRG